MSRREWRSLALLFALAVVGHIVRAVIMKPHQAPGAVVLFDKTADGNPRQQQHVIQELMRPVGATERIDIERANVNEIERLPGIGHALAARIVADRESHGPFTDLTGLGRVPGIGTATLVRLAPNLQFSGVSADISKSPTEGGQIDLNQASVSELDALPGIGPSKAKAIVAFRDSTGPFRQTDDLLRIPGLSRALVNRIAPLVVVR